MIRIAVGDNQVASCDGACHKERPGFDAVGIDAVMRAMQPAHALDLDGGGACALDLRAHRLEQGSQIGHLRLARAVLHQRLALSQHGSHQQVFRSGDGDLVEDQVRSAQLVRTRFQVAVLLGDDCAHLLQTFDVQVDGPTADGASARHGYARHAGASHQRPQNQRAGAHSLDDFVFGHGIRQVAAADGGRVRCFASADLSAHRGEQALLGLDVTNAGNILQRDFVLGQNCRRHAGQC